MGTIDDPGQLVCGKHTQFWVSLRNRAILAPGRTATVEIAGPKVPAVRYFG